MFRWIRLITFYQSIVLPDSNHSIHWSIQWKHTSVHHLTEAGVHHASEGTTDPAETAGPIRTQNHSRTFKDLKTFKDFGKFKDLKTFKDFRTHCLLWVSHVGFSWVNIVVLILIHYYRYININITCTMYCINTYSTVFIRQLYIPHILYLEHAETGYIQ